MIRDIRTAFLEQLDVLDWMDNKTKAAARHKALNMRYKVAYPEEILDANWLDKEHQVKFYENNLFYIPFPEDTENNKDRSFNFI